MKFKIIKIYLIKISKFIHKRKLTTDTIKKTQKDIQFMRTIIDKNKYIYDINTTNSQDFIENLSNLVNLQIIKEDLID